MLVMKNERKKNFLSKDFSVFKPFSSQQLIGAAASFKDLSSRDIQHESLNHVVVSGSSRSGHSGVRAPSVRCALVAENTPDVFCNNLLHKPSGVRSGFGTRALPKVAGAAATDGLKADIIKLPDVHEFESAEFAGAAVTDGLMADTIELPDVHDFEGAEFAGAAATEDQGVEFSAVGGTGEHGIIGLLDVPESDFSKNLAKSTASDVLAVSRLSSNSSGVSSHACVSYLDALLSAPACAPAALTAARRVAPLSAVVGFGMHGDDSSVHDACNSWSDTSRVQGPTGRRCTKGGVSGPAEDLRPVSEVEAGVNFRLAGRVRGQVAGSLPGRQPGTGTRSSQGKVLSHLPSTRRFLILCLCRLDQARESGN